MLATFFAEGLYTKALSCGKICKTQENHSLSNTWVSWRLTTCPHTLVRMCTCATGWTCLLLWQSPIKAQENPTDPNVGSQNCREIPVGCQSLLSSWVTKMSQKEPAWDASTALSRWYDEQIRQSFPTSRKWISYWRVCLDKTHTSIQRPYLKAPANI